MCKINILITIFEHKMAEKKVSEFLKFSDRCYVLISEILTIEIINYNKIRIYMKNSMHNVEREFGNFDECREEFKKIGDKLGIL